MYRVCHLATAAFAAAMLGACSASPQRAQPAPDANGRGMQPVQLAEAFETAMEPADNIDSLAAWTAPDGRTLLIGTAKASDRLVVYDGDTGATLRHVGSLGTGLGEMERPNGVAVSGDLLFVVERDNRRVQVLRLPGFEPLLVFGREHLQKPYGLWVRRDDDGSRALYVTDAYEEPDESVPPLDQLDRRIKRYRVAWKDADTLAASYLGAFGDTSPEGAIRVTESIFGDPAYDRVLVAEEDETYANEFKVYDQQLRFLGTTIGRDVLEAQAEGIALYACNDGDGYWLTTEQGKAGTTIHVFDRRHLGYVGAFVGRMVANTDGIWLHQQPTRRFPAGVLYAVHDDQGAVAFDWRDVAAALGLRSDCL